MLRIMSYSPDGVVRTDLTIDEVKTALVDSNSKLWLDFEDTPPEEDEPVLREVFGFHRLAIEDALKQSHVPKLDDWEDYLYIVLHAVTFDHSGGGSVDTLELDVFLGKNYLVTHHDKQIEALERIWSAIKYDQRFYKNGVDRLLYRLADEVVGSYMPVVEALDKAIDDAEDQVFSNPTSRTLEKIFSLKRDVLHLRRVIGPQREVLNRLARDEYAVVEVRTRVYFRDVYDHLVRMHDITETVRDLVSGALDTYLSVINNRMNDIMKTLTVITTLFMPISFLTGFFGMNFFVAVPPYSAFTTPPVLVAALLMVFLVPLAMFTWIRRRGWM